MSNDLTSLQSLISFLLISDNDIRDIKTLQPRIRIVGISDCVHEGSVITFLVKQNEFIFNALDENKLIKLAPVKKKKDDERFFALLEVDIETYKKAVKRWSLLGRLGCLFNLLRDRHYTMFQMYNGFNHAASNCKSELVCPRCAEWHDIKEYKAVNLCCINCSNLKSKENFENIAAWDSLKCQAHQQIINKLKLDVFGISI